MRWLATAQGSATGGLDILVCRDDPTVSKPARAFRKDRIQVALVVSGGIGDLLKSTHLVRAISDHFSCDLTIIMAHTRCRRSCGQQSLCKGDAHTQSLNTSSVSRIVFVIYPSLIYSCYGSTCAVCDASWIKNLRLMLSDRSSPDSSELRHTWTNIASRRLGTKFNFAFSRDTARFGLSAMKVSIATSGLPHR